jgi:hypothetical protein
VWDAHRGPVREPLSFLRRQFRPDGDRPFTHVLTPARIEPALRAIRGRLDRVFSPLVTLWVLLGPVRSADPPCRAAVARRIAPRSEAGLGPDRGLLPGQKASARIVRRGRGPPDRAGAGSRRGPAVAVAAAPR